MINSYQIIGEVIVYAGAIFGISTILYLIFCKGIFQHKYDSYIKMNQMEKRIREENSHFKTYSQILAKIEELNNELWLYTSEPFPKPIKAVDYEITLAKISALKWVISGDPPKSFIQKIKLAIRIIKSYQKPYIFRPDIHDYAS